MELIRLVLLSIKEMVGMKILVESVPFPLRQQYKSDIIL